MEQFDLDPQTKKDLEMFGKSEELVEAGEFSKQIDTKTIETNSMFGMILNYFLPPFIISGLLWTLNNFASRIDSKLYSWFLGGIMLGIVFSILHTLAYFTKKSFWIFLLFLGIPGIGVLVYLIFFLK